MRLVAVLLWDDAQRSRVCQAVRARAAVRLLKSVEQLVSLVRTGEADAVVSSLRTPEGRSLVAVLSALRASAPATPILVYTDVSAPNVQEVVKAIQAGVNGVIIAGQDDSPIRLERVLLDATESCSTARVRGIVGPLKSPNLRSLFSVIAGRTTTPLSVDALAVACHVSRRTLVNRARKASWPPPRRLISWSRLLHASALLDESDLRIERLAHELEFPSGSALSNMLHRYVGLSASQLRQRGAFEYVAKSFLRECGRAPRVVERRDPSQTHAPPRHLA